MDLRPKLDKIYHNWELVMDMTIVIYSFHGFDLGLIL